MLLKQKVELREALNQALDEEMVRDERVFILGEEVGEYNGAYKVTKGLLNKWGPKRIRDTPISELGFVGLAVGAAMTGLRPIVEFMSFNFSFVACDQIISNAATMYYMTGGRYSVPIVFRGTNGAAAQVSCQHSHCVEAMYSHFPGLIVVAPSNPYNAKGLLKSAIRNNNPVLFLENEIDYNMTMEIPIDEYLVPLGKACYVQEGTDLTLISYSRMLGLCKQAAKELPQYSIEIIDVQTIKPLDIPTILASVHKTHHVVIVEEGHAFGGISSSIACAIYEHAFDLLDAPISRVCQKETPLPYASHLEKASIPSVTRIKESIINTLR